MSIFNKVLLHLAKHTTEAPQKNTQDDLFVEMNRYTSLIRLQEERQLIEVLIQGYADSFQSMILGVDLYNQQLLIDDFSSPLHDKEALIGKTITLRHQHQRRMLLVTSELVDWEEESRSYLLNLPQKANYQPRRQETRVFLNGNIPLSATINPLYGSPWYASISNISMGGMRIVVTGNLRNQLHKHKLVKDCVVMLNNHTSIACPGRVKSFSYHARPYRRTEVSIAFESLSENNALQLHNFIERLSIAA